MITFEFRHVHVQNLSLQEELSLVFFDGINTPHLSFCFGQNISNLSSIKDNLNRKYLAGLFSL